MASEAMDSKIKITAEDDHQFDAYVSESNGPARGSIVLIQEIFGVNSHIRSVADGYAKDGFHVIVPALFDRSERNLELSYNAEDTKKGMAAISQIGLEPALKDVAASIRHARTQWPDLKTGVLGFCLGGSLGWLAATRLDPAAVVCYYGGQIAKNAAETPHCPVMMHFGAKDAHIGPEQIETIRQAHPEIPVFVYEAAGHGFNCDQRKDYEPQSAALAGERTLEFFGTNL